MQQHSYLRQRRTSRRRTTEDSSVAPPLTTDGLLDHSSHHSNIFSGNAPEQTRIVGGQIAPLNSYPSYIQWVQGCGGVCKSHWGRPSQTYHGFSSISLISLFLCLSHYSISRRFNFDCRHCNSINNAIGRYALYVGGDGTHKSGTKLFAEAAYQHPLYSPKNYQAYDFVVLKLPQKVEGVPLAKLNSDPAVPVNQQPLTVVGHGVLDEKGTHKDLPPVYYHVTIPYIEDCTPYYQNRVDNDHHLCVGDMPNGGKDSCQGDSGGPIMDAEGVVMGIVSWGIVRFFQYVSCGVLTVATTSLTHTLVRSLVYFIVSIVTIGLRT